MTPEKIIDAFKDMGGGIFIIIAVLLAAVVIVAVARMQSGQTKSNKDNPAGQPGSQQGESGNQSGG